MRDKDAIFTELRATLVELFELDPERVTPDARLYDELVIDCFDAIDLMDRLRRQTGRRIDSNRFRSVRTVSDLVDTIHQLLNET
jgi:acyl carrier protein